MKIINKIIILILLAATILVLSIWLGLYFVKPSQPSQTSFSKIYSIIIPENNFAAKQRTELFSELSKLIAQPKTIIIISQNHNSAGNENIQTSDQEWNVGQDKINSNKTVVSFLTEKNLATNNPSSFTNEQGISNALLDIRNNFPGAEIVPIIFKNPSKDEISELEKGLYLSCKNCLMVASVSFSDDQPALLAQLHDETSIKYLETLDAQNIFTAAEVDSGSSLALLTMWAKDHNTLRFVLKSNTNSGVIAKDPDAKSTTHISGWYEEGETIKPEDSISFTIAGDMLFARTIYHEFSDDFNEAFSELGNRVFWGTDASAANLEGSITNKKIVDNIRSDNVNFRFSPKIVETLSFMHIKSVSHANNHSNNAGQEGIDTTRSLLDKAGIQIFGGPTVEDVSRVAYFKRDGISLAVIGIEMTLEENQKSIVPIIKEIKKDENMRVIIMPHWGIEYVTKHNLVQEKSAHLWIDAGADAVIGSHPHIIQDAELYKGVPIFYSLGNFLFDQYMSYTKKGLIISGKFTQDGLILFSLPTQSDSLYKPKLITGEEKTKILDLLYVPFKEYITDTPAGKVIKISK